MWFETDATKGATLRVLVGGNLQCCGKGRVLLQGDEMGPGVVMVPCPQYFSVDRLYSGPEVCNAVADHANMMEQ